MINALRQSLLQLENSIPSAFMHVNWSHIRKSWMTSVNLCNSAKDFAKATIVLQECIKPVVFASVWHDQLGKINSYTINRA